MDPLNLFPRELLLDMQVEADKRERKLNRLSLFIRPLCCERVNRMLMNERRITTRHRVIAEFIEGVLFRIHGESRAADLVTSSGPILARDTYSGLGVTPALSRGALLRCCADGVACKIRTDRYRRCLIENDKHLRDASGRFIETADGELDYCLDLFAVQTVEPFHDVVDIGSGFDIFENCGDRHTGSA